MLSHTHTRFRVFPQAPYLHPGRPPEIVHIPKPPGTIGPGPSDDRLYVIDPIGKPWPYGLVSGPNGAIQLSLPPWQGPIRPPVRPGPGGHFDHVPVDAPEFGLVHVYAIIRFALEVWERYFGSPIQWHFLRHFRRLEVSMLPTLDNARAGYGYMEVGEHPNEDGTVAHYALNFDVIAHELGHLIIYSRLGVPNLVTAQGEYFGFHEAAADITAMIASLHFASMVEQLLEDTRGNLYALNELNRFAELSPTTQIRLASNTLKMSDFAVGWEDEHKLSQPLTGALFDTLVDIFQENLVDRGLVGRDMADLSDQVGRFPEYGPVVQAAFDTAYPGREQGFHEALRDARDYLGLALAKTWERLSPHFLTYVEIGNTLLAVDRALSGGRYWEPIYESFDWREIGKVRVGPRLAPPDESSHAVSVRALVPVEPQLLPKMSYRERMLLARRLT